MNLRSAVALALAVAAIAVMGVAGASAASIATATLYSGKLDCGSNADTAFPTEGGVKIVRSVKNLLTVTIHLRNAAPYDLYSISLWQSTSKNGGPPCYFSWSLGYVGTDANGRGNGTFQYQLAAGDKNLTNFFVSYHNVFYSDQGDSTTLTVK